MSRERALSREALNGTGNKHRFRKAVNYTLHPDTFWMVRKQWRSHIALDGHLCDNMSEYVEDLIRRDACAKESPHETR